MVMPWCTSLLCPYSTHDTVVFLCAMQACSAMDALAQRLMKGAVNCDKHSDLQNSVNQLGVECGLRFWVILESTSSSLFDNCALVLPVLYAG